MANQEFLRASPQEGFSITRQVMNDAVDFYLRNGSPAVAREHVEKLANDLKFYDDSTEAYREAMARICAAEAEERRQAEERQQQQQRTMMMSLMDVVKPARKTRKKSAGEDAPKAGEDIPKADDDAPKSDGAVTLPPKLASEQAMRIWRRLQEKGLVDDRYQPMKLSRTKAATMADEILAKLSSENEMLVGMDEKWTPFEELWGLKHMRADHYRALSQNRTEKFRNEIKELLADIT